MFFLKTSAGLIIRPVEELRSLKDYNGSFSRMTKDFLLYVTAVNIFAIIPESLVIIPVLLMMGIWFAFQ